MTGYALAAVDATGTCGYRPMQSARRASPVCDSCRCVQARAHGACCADERPPASAPSLPTLQLAALPLQFQARGRRAQRRADARLSADVGLRRLRAGVGRRRKRRSPGGRGRAAGGSRSVAKEQPRILRGARWAALFRIVSRVLRPTRASSIIPHDSPIARELLTACDIPRCHAARPSGSSRVRAFDMLTRIGECRTFQNGKCSPIKTPRRCGIQDNYYFDGRCSYNGVLLDGR